MLRPLVSLGLCFAVLCSPSVFAADALPPSDRAVSALLGGGDPAPARAAALALADDCERSRAPAACYRTAHARYVEAILSLSKGRDAAAGALVDCGVRLAALLADPEWGAEAKALLSGCYGLSIALNPMKGMSLGPKSASLIEDALAAAPESPRVHYFAAVRLARTPPAWGGNPAKALEHARRAVSLAAAAPADAVPGWGAVDAARLVSELEAKQSPSD